MTLTLRLLQSQYSICENGKYVIDSDKLEFNYMATKRGVDPYKAFPRRSGGRWHRCSILKFKMNSISRVKIKIYDVFIGGDG